MATILPEPGPGWIILAPDALVDELDQAYFFDKGWVSFMDMRRPIVAKEYGACVRRYAGYPATLLNYAGGPLEPIVNGEPLKADDLMWFKDAWRPVPASRVGQSEMKYAQFFARLADMEPGYRWLEWLAPGNYFRDDDEIWLDGRWQPISEDLRTGVRPVEPGRAYRCRWPEFPVANLRMEPVKPAVREFAKDMSLDEAVAAGLLVRVATVKPRTRDEHIAEFWLSFVAAVNAAGGDAAILSGGTITAAQMASTLAQNGIRIVYDPKTMGK